MTHPSRFARQAKKAGQYTFAAAAACLLLFGVEALLAIPGPDDHFHNPDRGPVLLGGPGKPLVYVVMGDSTAAGRGGLYRHGIAMETARHLAHARPVRLVNLGVSGAKIADVVRDQLPTAMQMHPDVVLLSVGANDVTHFTPDRNVYDGLTAILSGLGKANPGIRIVLTGSPEMGTIRRFAQPLRWLAGVRTAHLNEIVSRVMDATAGSGDRVIWAPIAHETGPLFQKNAGLFAPDRFHPNDRGYATWLPVLETALDRSLQATQFHSPPHIR